MISRTGIREEYFTWDDREASIAELVADPARFASRFNSIVPGAFRCVTVEDIRDMTNCGLIGRYGFYERSDLETIRGILRYEQVRETRTRRTRGKPCKHLDLGQAKAIIDTKPRGSVSKYPVENSTSSRGRTGARQREKITKGE